MPIAASQTSVEVAGTKFAQIYVSRANPLPHGLRGDDVEVYRVTPPWEGRSKHFTQEYKAFAVTLMYEMSVRVPARS